MCVNFQGEFDAIQTAVTRDVTRAVTRDVTSSSLHSTRKRDVTLPQWLFFCESEPRPLVFFWSVFHTERSMRCVPAWCGKSRQSSEDVVLPRKICFEPRH